MESVGLKLRLIFEQAIENVNRFPNPTGNKVAEQGNIRVANVMVGLSERPSYVKEFDIAQL